MDIQMTRSEKNCLFPNKGYDSFVPVLMKDLQFAESNEKSISQLFQFYF